MHQNCYFSLASSSAGNCGLLTADNTAILFDLGVSFRRLKQGLATAGLEPDGLSGVLLTHEHTDHVKGLPMFLKKCAVPVFATRGTARELEQKYAISPDRLQLLGSGDTLQIGDVSVTAFDTPHDAAESVGYIAAWQGHRFGYATDMGFVPRRVAEQLQGCETVVLESNHEPAMLAAGPYPYDLQQRVAGPGGHLSNQDCAACVAELVRYGTRTVILAHLSGQNNMPELALQQTQRLLHDLPHCTIYVAPRDQMAEPVPLAPGREGEAGCSKSV